jgi:hypothetical protein
MVEPRRDAMNHGALERLVIEDRRQQKRREFRLAPRRLIRLLANPRKKRITMPDADDSGERTRSHGVVLQNPALFYHEAPGWRKPDAQAWRMHHGAWVKRPIVRSTPTIMIAI